MAKGQQENLNVTQQQGHLNGTWDVHGKPVPPSQPGLLPDGGGDASGAQVGSPEPTKVLLPGFRALKVLTAEESSG